MFDTVNTRKTSCVSRIFRSHFAYFPALQKVKAQRWLPRFDFSRSHYGLQSSCILEQLICQRVIYFFVSRDFFTTGKFQKRRTLFRFIIFFEENVLLWSCKTVFERKTRRLHLFRTIFEINLTMLGRIFSLFLHSFYSLSQHFTLLRIA